MTSSSRVPVRKRRDAYHHGNLRQALVETAVRTIRERGVDALTLRDVGAALRVSRTALYRHFADKDALLAAVATEGFRAFRVALSAAWEGAGRGRAGLVAQGHAYLRFAIDNPSHYRVMFGGFVDKTSTGTELATESEAAFGVLVNALVELQQTGVVGAGDPLDQALFVWSSVHGAAMLAISGLLSHDGRESSVAAAAVVPHIVTALEAPAAPRATPEPRATSSPSPSARARRGPSSTTPPAPGTPRAR